LSNTKESISVSAEGTTSHRSSVLAGAVVGEAEVLGVLGRDHRCVLGDDQQGLGVDVAVLVGDVADDAEREEPTDRERHDDRGEARPPHAGRRRAGPGRPPARP
jgi:hypothetical protein